MIFCRDDIGDPFQRAVVIASCKTCVSTAREVIGVIYGRRLFNSLWYNLHCRYSVYYLPAATNDWQMSSPQWVFSFPSRQWIDRNWNVSVKPAARTAPWNWAWSTSRLPADSVRWLRGTLPCWSASGLFRLSILQAARLHTAPEHKKRYHQLHLGPMTRRRHRASLTIMTQHYTVLSAICPCSMIPG